MRSGLEPTGLATGPTQLGTSKAMERAAPARRATAGDNPGRAVDPRRTDVAWIIERLREEYGSGTAQGAGDPTDCLIRTILSQHTADRNSSVAFAMLKERYPLPDDVERADVGELAATIRFAGLGNLKARRIQKVLRTLRSRFGTTDLRFLRSASLAEAREILLALPGVGPKTAACVLLFSCSHPALPVDTHVHRLARRLGLIGPRDSAERAHDELEALVPVDDVYDFHVNLIRHGRQVCVARDPRCGACVLQRGCRYFHGELDRF